MALTSALEPEAMEIYQSQYLLFVLQTFDEIMRDNVAIASTTQKALSSERLCSLLNSLLKEPTLQHEAINGHDENFCLQASYESQRRLRLTLVLLSLKSLILAESADQNLPASTAQGLVHLQTKLSMPLQQCKEHIKHEGSKPVSMLKPNTSDTRVSNTGCNWREILAADLKAKAAEQAQQTVQTVERICEDFEKRCESIEEPLREEEQKFSEAQKSVRRLEDQIKTLGAEATDRMLYLDGLEAEKTELEIRLKETIDQNSSLTGQTEELRRLLKEANDERSHTVSVERSERDALDFQYKTKLSAKEVEVENLQLDLSASGSQNRELQAQVDADKVEKKRLNKDIESLCANLMTSEEESRILTGRISEKENGLLNAVRNAKELENELIAIRTQLEEANKQVQQVKNESSLSIGSLKTELAKVRIISLRLQDISSI